mmetsp:Transcript_9285/g.20227  ORF Transcript_9285/g.20227 Transcript_9285/m.20227 type:complete len:163 (+) Transcript_9285:1-489(+)
MLPGTDFYPVAGGRGTTTVAEFHAAFQRLLPMITHGHQWEVLIQQVRAVDLLSTRRDACVGPDVVTRDSANAVVNTDITFRDPDYKETVEELRQVGLSDNEVDFRELAFIGGKEDPELKQLVAELEVAHQELAVWREGVQRQAEVAVGSDVPLPLEDTTMVL